MKLLADSLMRIARLLCVAGIVAVLSLPMACGTAAEPAARPATLPADGSVTISGRVVDQNGKPVADCQVSAFSGYLGEHYTWTGPHGETDDSANSEGLSNAGALGDHYVLPGTWTDARGAFSLRLPFAGLGYGIEAEKDGSGYSCGVLADHSQQLELRLSLSATGRIAGHVFEPGRAMVPGLALTLIGEHGITAHTVTDSTGAFVFSGLPDQMGVAVLCADRGGAGGKVLVLEKFHLGQSDAPQIDLVDPAVFAGMVRDERGNGIAGVAIALRPAFGGGLQWGTLSDARGQWRITGLPPGEYVAQAESADYFDRPRGGDSNDLLQHDADSGESVSLNFTLRRKALIRGIVVDRTGTPIAGAQVSAPVSWIGQTDDQFRTAVTGAHGRFTLKTGHIGGALAITAADGRSGAAQATAGPLAAGAGSPEIRLVLPGMFHLRGVLLDPDGKPIRNVECGVGWPGGASAWSDQHGRFDLGRISLPPRLPAGRPPTIDFDLPSPRGVDWTSVEMQSFQPVPAGDPRQTYFEPTAVTFPASPGAVVNLSVRLKRAETVVIAGQIVDPRGVPIQGAEAYLFAGTPGKDWPKAVVGWSETYPMDADPLSGCSVDADGKFQMIALRRDGLAAGDATCFSIGVVSGGWARKLITNVMVPKDTRQADVKIEIDPNAAPLTGN